VSSHDIDEVERLADWIAFLERGRLLLAEPVASLFGRCRLIEVTVQGVSPSVPPLEPTWLLQGVAGRTVPVHRHAARVRRCAAVIPVRHQIEARLPLSVGAVHQHGAFRLAN
jgi:ABC-type multidrug transport system ATPase subunit